MLQPISSLAIGLIAPTSLLLNPSMVDSSVVNPSPLNRSPHSSIELPQSPPLLIAHQNVKDGEVSGRIHLDPDDSPFAGQPSFSWFHLYSPDGAITLANCNCSLLIYDSQNRQIAKPELSETEMEGHDERPMTASITFPGAGVYQVVLTGQPKEEGEFQSFEIAVPITVRP